MTEYKTLRVPEPDYEQAKTSKKDSETWGEFLQRCSNNPPEIKEFVEASESNESEIARMVVADLKSELPSAIAEELR